MPASPLKQDDAERAGARLHQLGLEPRQLAAPSDERAVPARARRAAGRRTSDREVAAGSTARSIVGARRRRSRSPDHPAATRRSIERTSADGSVPVSSAEHDAVVLVRPERVGLPAVARQGLDLQATGAVTKRVRGDVGFERRDRLAGPPARDEQLGAVLDGDAPQLVEPRRLGLGPRLVAELVERLAVPQRQRLVERDERGRGARSSRAAGR